MGIGSVEVYGLGGGTAGVLDEDFETFTVVRNKFKIRDVERLKGFA